MQTTWQSHEKHSELTERSDRPDSVYAFAKQAVHGTVDDVIETVKENSAWRKGDMTDELVCELNLALTPEEALANRHIEFSKQLAKLYPAVIELNGVIPPLVFAPHLTLYQVPIRIEDMPRLVAGLETLAAQAPVFSLEATEFAANESEGSCEVRYEAAHDLMQLQDKLIEAVNPLRGTLLLERDPAGRKLTDRLTESGTVGDNIRRTGFDAVGDPAQGGTFQPHVTINWFELGTSVELNARDWPPVSDFNGRFGSLGVYLLGPYGTAAQRLAALELGARDLAM